MSKRKHIKKVKKFVPPSATMQIFLLANLDPKNWRRQDKEYVSDKKDKTVNKHMISADEILLDIEDDE